MLFDLNFQVGLRARHELLVNNCPCLFLSRMLDTLLGENVADIADGRFAIARERARIGHVAIPRRLDDLNGRLVHIVFETMDIGIKVDTAEVAN